MMRVLQTGFGPRVSGRGERKTLTGLGSRVSSLGSGEGTPADSAGAAPGTRIDLTHLSFLLAIFLLTVVSGCAPKMDKALTVWATDARREVYPTSRGPDARDATYDAAKAAVSLQAAINQTVSFQVAIHSGLQPVPRVNLDVSNLRNGAGQPLRAKVRIYRAWPVNVRAFRAWQRLYRQDDCRPRAIYDVLVPAETPGTGLPTDLPAGTMLLTWIDLHVEKGSEPGPYAGTIRVSAADQAAWTLNLSVDVQSFALPDAPALPAFARFDARQLCRRHLRLGTQPYAPIRLNEHNPLAKEAIELIHATAKMLNEHGITAVPTGYEPAVHVDADGQVRIEWEDYDQLVQPLIDGSAFEERIRPAAWPLPMDAEHPPMPRDGMSRATYQSLLRQYTQQAADHFRLRRWYDQSYAEVDPQGNWPEDYATWAQLTVPTIRQADDTGRLLVRLPREEMSAYGWFGWPATRKITDAAAIVSVPARFFLYESAESRPPRQWLRPDIPPFSPSLHLGAGALDPEAVAWAAWRLKAAALDLPDQADWPESQEIEIVDPTAASDDWLFWPGTSWGASQPIPSMRLKRLRAGLEECKYLYLLRQHGRVHVDEMLAESLVPLAGSLAYGRQYVEGLDGEVQLDEASWDAGTRLMAEEVQMAVAGEGSDEVGRFNNRIAWQQFLGKTRQVKAWAEPVRLSMGPGGLIRAQVAVEVLNLRAEPIAGSLQWADLPEMWKATKKQVAVGPIQPFQRARVVLTCEGPGLGTDTAGHGMWGLALTCPNIEPIPIRATLSAAAAMRLQKPVTVDGDLRDWKPSRFSMLSGFQPFGGTISAGQSDLRRTDAFVAADGRYLYIAARMQDAAREMRISQRNTVQYDGSVPAGEDVIEILIDPDNGASGGPERLIHVIVKANGAAVANQGVDIQPPLCKARPLGTGVLAATKIYQDAWTAEVAIPLDVIKTVRPQAAYWGLNVCRMRANNIEYSSWSGARIGSYHPDSLGNLLVPVR